MVRTAATGRSLSINPKKGACAQPHLTLIRLDIVSGGPINEDTQGRWRMVKREITHT